MVAHGVLGDDELRADERAATALRVEPHDVRLAGREPELAGHGAQARLGVVAAAHARAEAGEQALVGRSLALAHHGERREQHPEHHHRQRLRVQRQRQHARQGKAQRHGQRKEHAPAQAHPDVGRGVQPLGHVEQHEPREADDEHLRRREHRRGEEAERHAQQDAHGKPRGYDEDGREPQVHGVARLLGEAVGARQHHERDGHRGQLRHDARPVRQTKHASADGHGDGHAEHDEKHAGEHPAHARNIGGRKPQVTAVISRRLACKMALHAPRGRHKAHRRGNRQRREGHHAQGVVREQVEHDLRGRGHHEHAADAHEALPHAQARVEAGPRQARPRDDGAVERGHGQVERRHGRPRAGQHHERRAYDAAGHRHHLRPTPTGHAPAREARGERHEEGARRHAHVLPDLKEPAGVVGRQALRRVAPAH